MTFNTVLVLTVVSVLAIGQLLFKMVGLRISGGGFQDLLQDPVGAFMLGVALVLYAVATIAWIWVLRTTPLSSAYMFMAMGFVLVPIMSHYFLGEVLNARIILGSAMIIAGILVSATA